MVKSNEKIEQSDMFGFMKPEIIGLRVGKVEIKNGEIAAFIQGTCNFGTVMDATPECWGMGLAEAIILLARDADTAKGWLDRVIASLTAKNDAEQPVLIDGVVIDEGDDVIKNINIDTTFGELKTGIFSMNAANSADGVVLPIDQQAKNVK